MTSKQSAQNQGQAIRNDNAGDLFKVNGFNVKNEDPVDGTYIEQPYMRNEYPYFVRISHEPDSDPMVMWYYPKRQLWMINNRSQLGSENAKAVVKSKDKRPELIQKSWYAFDMESGRFVSAEGLKFRRLSPQETEIERVDRLIVSGRLGYNRAMNGEYTRGKNIHCGKSYYTHIGNDFTIRWFETKWVVDWRGLHNDNIGAAVCKEDVPEPWMTTIPWRIYDGKAKDKKWKFDPQVKMLPKVVKSSQQLGTFE